MKITILGFLYLGTLAFFGSAAQAQTQTGPGTALSFNGVNAYVTVPRYINIAPTTEVTVEFWMQANSVQLQAPFCESTFVNGSVFAASVPYGSSGNGTVYWDFGNINTGGRLSYPLPSSITGTWQHFAFVASQSGNFMQIYQNGVLVAQKRGMTPLVHTNLDLTIGGYTAGIPYNGLLDEFRIWNVALTQAQIQASMNSTLTLPQSNLAAYWRFDEGAGNYAYDASGNGQTGTLENGPLWVGSTVPFVPGVTTLEASQIGIASGTFNGLVNPNGLSANAWFQWGATTNYGFTTASTNMGSGSNSVLAATSFTGLSLGQSFNYRVVASNSVGTAFGNNQASIAGIGVPYLQIAQSGTNVMISWPSAATSFSLQSSGSLVNGASWGDVPEAPEFYSNSNLVILPIGYTNQFFRLTQTAATLGMSAPGFNQAPTNYFGGCLPGTVGCARASVGNQSNGSGSGDDSASSGIGQIQDDTASSQSSDGSSGGGTSEAQDTGGGEVFLNNGQLIRRAKDLVIPGRGFSWKMDRTYRSAVAFTGPLAHNWDFSYNRRLQVLTNGNVIRMDGYGRADLYVSTTNGFVSPAGFFTELAPQGDGTYLERDRHGGKVYYSATNSLGMCQLTSLRDHNGNQMQFEYNNLGQLSRVLDTLGRPIVYQYDPVTGQLISVQDFIGRTIRYNYDAHGDLVAVTSPAVTATPDGNDFPEGKTTQYTYSSGFTSPGLNHNFLSVTSPNEVAVGGGPSVLVQYQNNTNSPDVGRVTQLTLGGMNASGVAAGGTISYQYLSLGTASSNDFNTPVFQNTVTDRNGNQTRYQFNQIGNIVQVRKYPRGLRAQEPAYYQTQCQYNQDGKMLTRTNPMGNVVRYTYDSSNPDRFQQGNLLSVVRQPDAPRGGDQTAITTTYTYEPVYNHVLTSTSPRGNDPTYVPQNGGAQSAARYTTTYTYDYQEGQDYADLATELNISPSAAQTRLAAVPMNLGDVNGDGLTNQIQGNRIRATQPTVVLLPTSNEAGIEGSTNQPIVSLYSYNSFGQTTSHTDPEGNVTQYSYYPANNPNGDGTNFTSGASVGPFGYLQQTTTDAMANSIRDSRSNPTPAAIVNRYSYDQAGNITRKTDGRGIATDYAVNQLNQVVQITRASAHGLLTNNLAEPIPLTDFQYLTRIYFDANNNVIHQQVEDYGNTSGTGGFIDTFYQYDILNHQVQTSQQVDINTSLVSNYRYDANGHQVLAVAPAGTAATISYDERNFKFQVTQGAASTPSAMVGSFTLTNSRTGTPSVYTYNYDYNGNMTESVDAADKDGSAANNSTIAGVGDVTKYSYDGFDRQIGGTNAVGSQTLSHLDPDGRVIYTVCLGPVNGPSPINNFGSNNVPLSIVEYCYDELGRQYQKDKHLFVSSGVTTQRPVSITDGSLTPGDNKVTSRYEYDRNSRQAFVIDDNSDTNRWSYDGASRTITSLDAEGNFTQSAYDSNGNVIEKQTTDVSQASGVTSELFVTTYFYDSLNRAQITVNNIGQTTECRYDSRNNVVAATDASGPPGGNIARRAFSGGALTANTTNSYGNVSLFYYDGINRQIRSDSVMTASGQGDGINIGCDIYGNKSLFGVPYATPTPDTNQAGGDGLITVLYTWDANSMLSTLTDDNGNQTQRTYDNHNRMLTETKGVCLGTNLATICATPTTVQYQYDADGDCIQFQDENGSVRTNHFDAVRRLISKGISRAANVVGTTAETYQYDGLSRMVLGTDNNDPADPTDDSTITYAYDSLGRVVEETQQIGQTNALAIDSAWTGRNRTAVTYPNGRQITKTYDRLHRLQSMADYLSTTNLVNYTYIGRARVAERVYAQNNTALTFLNTNNTIDLGYDGLRRPVALRNTGGASNTTLVGFNYTFDRRNNPLTELKLHAANDSELYGYDSGSRLLQLNRGTLNSNQTAIITPTQSTTLQTNWLLDGVGNWDAVNNETREYNSFNDLIERSNAAATAVVSDNRGNEATNGALVLQYDYRNRLRRVSNQTNGLLIATYAYDTRNRRISKVVTNSGTLNGTTRYYSGGPREFEERNGTNGLVQQYVYGRYIDEPLVLDRNLTGGTNATGPGNQRLFYHQNKQHSIFALTDATGKVVEGYQYEGYGARTVFAPATTNGTVTFSSNDVVTVGGNSPRANPYGFTGRRFDPETGFYYYRNRYLDPIQGRFITRDPIGYRGGSMGLHEYAGGRSTQAVDPSGQFVDVVFEQFGPVLEGWGQAVAESPLYQEVSAHIAEFSAEANAIGNQMAQSAFGSYESWDAAEADAEFREAMDEWGDFAERFHTAWEQSEGLRDAIMENYGENESPGEANAIETDATEKAEGDATWAQTAMVVAKEYAQDAQDCINSDAKLRLANYDYNNNGDQVQAGLVSTSDPNVSRIQEDCKQITYLYQYAQEQAADAQQQAIIAGGTTATTTAAQSAAASVAAISTYQNQVNGYVNVIDTAEYDASHPWLIKGSPSPGPGPGPGPGSGPSSGPTSGGTITPTDPGTTTDPGECDCP